MSHIDTPVPPTSAEDGWREILDEQLVVSYPGSGLTDAEFHEMWFWDFTADLATDLAALQHQWTVQTAPLNYKPTY